MFAARGRRPGRPEGTAAGIQPPGRSVRIEQPHRDTQFRCSPVTSQVFGRVHQLHGNTPAAEWPGNRQLMHQRDAPLRETRVIGHPQDRGNADYPVPPDCGQAGAIFATMIGKVLAGISLVVTDPSSEKPDSRCVVIRTHRPNECRDSLHEQDAGTSPGALSCRPWRVGSGAIN